MGLILCFSRCLFGFPLALLLLDEPARLKNRLAPALLLSRDQPLMLFVTLRRSHAKRRAFFTFASSPLQLLDDDPRLHQPEPMRTHQNDIAPLLLAVLGVPMRAEINLERRQLSHHQLLDLLSRYRMGDADLDRYRLIKLDQHIRPDAVEPGFLLGIRGLAEVNRAAIAGKQQIIAEFANDLLGKLMQRRFTRTRTIRISVVRKVMLIDFAFAGHQRRTTLGTETLALQPAHHRVDRHHGAGRISSKGDFNVRHASPITVW